MKTHRMLLFLLIAVLLLSACAGTPDAGDAAGGQPGSDAASGTPESAAASDVPSSAASSLAPALSDSAAPEQGADEPAPDARTLTREEMDALWQQLDGAWRVEHPETDDPAQMLEFTRGSEDEFVLISAVIASEGQSNYIGEVTVADGVYQLIVHQTGVMMSISDYEPDARTTYTLCLREDGIIELSSSTPPIYGQDSSREEEDFMRTHWRRASDEEEQQLSSSANGYVLLENGDMILRGYFWGPVQFHRETPEEAHERGL